MQRQPFKARLFIVAVYLFGVFAGVGALVLPIPSKQADLWELWVFGVLAILAGGKKIRLMRHKSQEDQSSVQLGFALSFAALLTFGPAAAFLVAVLNSVSSCVYPRRQPLYQLLFNVALAAGETYVSAWLFVWLNGGSLVLDPVRSIPAVTASALCFFLINTLGVAMVIALCSRQAPFLVWRQAFLWTAPNHLAGAGISTLAALFSGQHMAGVLLLLTPAVLVMYQSYATSTARSEEKQQHIDKLADLYLSTIKSLALAIDAKDEYTHQHILRVQKYAMATAAHMGLSGDELRGIETGALLHDIGKLGIPESVLLKPGRLTDEEFATIKKHPEIGADILDPVEFPWPVLPAVKYHHEKWDGSGYPEGLKGEKIPLPGRILAVADVYDALTSTRSYREAWNHERAIALIQKESGTHFDPTVAEAFLQIIDGIVEEMAREGYGPLVRPSASAQGPTRNAELSSRDIQRILSELRELCEGAQTLAASRGLQETLVLLGQKLEALFPRTACVFLFWQEDGLLAARGATGVNGDYFAGCRTLSPASTSLRVAREREPFLGNFDPDDLLLSFAQSAQWEALRSAVIVPILHQETVLGTINLYHPEQEIFTADDRRILTLVAERVAGMLYNGLLFDQTRAHAVTDPLTGLYNLRYLTQHIEERCRQAVGGSAPAVADGGFALLCLDLDGFRAVNDYFGPQRTDEALCALSARLRSAVQGRGIVARSGGDTFLIVLDDAGSEEGRAMAAHLKALVEDHDFGLVHPRLGALRLGVSIGYACFPEHGHDCATLLPAAEVRLRRDKTERRLIRLTPPRFLGEVGPDPLLRAA